MKLSIIDIRRLVCKKYGISKDDIIGRRRLLKIVRPRQIAMTLCRECLPTTLTQIAIQFGRRDHSTVCSAINKIKDLESKNPIVKQRIDELRHQIYALQIQMALYSYSRGLDDPNDQDAHP